MKLGFTFKHISNLFLSQSLCGLYDKAMPKW